MKTFTEFFEQGVNKPIKYLVPDINSVDETIPATKSNYLFIFATENIMGHKLFWMSKNDIDLYKYELESIDDSENHGKNLYQVAQQRIEKGAEYILIYYNIAKQAWLVRGQNNTESHGRAQLNRDIKYFKNIQYFKNVSWDVWIQYIENN